MEDGKHIRNGSATHPIATTNELKSLKLLNSAHLFHILLFGCFKLFLVCKFLSTMLLTTVQMVS